MAQYFPKLIDMLEKLGTTLSLYGQYEDLFPDDPRFKNALCAVYRDVLTLLEKAKHVFRRRGLALFFKGTWSTFESDFRDDLVKFSGHTFVLEGETTLAHRKYVQKALGPGSSRTEELPYTGPGHLERWCVMKWLDSVDTTVDLVQHARLRTTGTGLWLVQEELFTKWKGAPESTTLWIHGIPGAGKTVLSTTIINHLKELHQYPGHVVTFFYFDRLDREKRTELSLVTSIVAQICASSHELPDTVKTAFQNATLHGRGKLSSSDSPVSLLKAVTASLERLYIVVDGIDECENPVDILELLRDLLTSSSNARLLVLSRDIPSIRKALSIHPTLQINPAYTNQDIRIYLAMSTECLPTNDPTLVTSITKRVTEKSNGMFLFAHLIMESLAKATSPAQLMDQLEDLPVMISDFYAIHLERLTQESDARQLLARKLFRWICSSRRPLSWIELQDALVDGALIEHASQPLVPFKSAVLELGSPFVVYQEHTDRFHLQHLSMRDFLVSSSSREGLSKRARQFCFSQAEGERELARVCLYHILAVDSSTKHGPLTEYATVFWCEHLLMCPWSRDLHDLLVDFIGDTIRRRNWIQDMLRYGNKGFSLQKIFKLQAGINDWARSSDLEDEQHGMSYNLDWSEDVVQILLHLSDEANNDDTLQLNYFEKLMVIRDLTRLLNQSKRLADGVHWLETARASRSCSQPIELVWILNSLAILYDQQGETLRSLETQKQALSIQEAKLGPCHLETINTVNELGRIYRHLGDYDKASKMHLRALAVLEDRLPNPQDDLQVIWTISTLARTYRKQHQANEALVLFERAYETRSRALGPTHPHTLWILGDMGATYRDLGCPQDAEDCHRRALEGRIESLGAIHPDTLWSMNDLGVILAESGRGAEALALQEQALEGQIQVLGGDHKHAVWTRHVIQGLRKTEETVV